METHTPNHVVTRQAADDLVEFTLMAFAPPYLVWTAEVNTGLAEMAWNMGPQGPVRASHYIDPRMGRLVETLLQARRTRWGHQRFEVEDLRVGLEDGEMVLFARLTWDGGESYRPIRIAVDGIGLGEAEAEGEAERTG